MKTKHYSLLLSAFIALIAGCSSFPVSTQTVAIPPGLKPGDVIEIAIDVAREEKFPPATKIDKENGIVEFGKFGSPVVGVTGQVRLKNDSQAEVSIQRGSVYITMPVDQIANEFRTKFETKLREAGERAGNRKSPLAFFDIKLRTVGCAKVPFR